MSYSNAQNENHNYDHMPNLNTDFNDTLSDNSFFDDETEPMKDSIAIIISAEDASRLYNDSQYNKVPLETKTNQIIKNYLDWHALAPDAKMVYMPKSWISKVLSRLTEQQVSELARDAAKEFKDLCLLLRGEFTEFSFLDVIETWSRINKMPTRLVRNPDEFRLLVNHDMGYKYSLLVKEIFKYIIINIFHMKMEFFITEGLLQVRILMANYSWKHQDSNRTQLHITTSKKEKIDRNG
jgi:hypothetical protein